MIRLKQVSKKFGAREIFSGLDLTLENGKVYALIGSSGCGKTTLLNIIAKLESYDSGEVLYKDKNLKDMKSSDFFRYELGYLFQNFGLIENQSIEDNLKLGLIGQKLKKEEVERRQAEALKIVGLSYLKPQQKIFELSGGEAQRVALAKVILKNPPLILADEPTAALDPNTSKEIMDILLTLKNEERTIIIATHNPMIWGQVDEVIKVEELSH